MPFKGITFAGQNVTPKNDGGLYQAHYGDGILWGCSMAISGDDLVIQSGEFIAGGRVCQVDGATNVDLSTRTLTNGYIQVVMDFDISKPEGSQWNIHLPLIESATTTFPALTQGNINDTDTLYQLELAVVQISGGNLTAITNSLFVSGALLRGVSNIINADGDIIGKIDGRNWDNNGHAPMFGSCQSDGTTIGGMIPYSDGTVTIGGTGGEIRFRSNGLTTGIGEVSIDSGGQFHGGVTRKQASGNGRTISGNSFYDILTLSGLDSSGLYVLQAHCIYNLTNNTGQFVWGKFNGFWSESFWIPMKTNWEINHMALVWGQSSYTFQMSPQGSNNGGTVSSVVINAFQIA